MTREEAIYINKSDVMRLLKKHHRNGGTDVDGDWVEGAYSESLYDDIQALSPITPKQSFEGMTNGEVIKAVFPYVDTAIEELLNRPIWWNEPYGGDAE